MKLTAQIAGDRSETPRVTWRGRDGLRIANDRIVLTVLTLGGALAELGFAGTSGVVVENTLWESPWLDSPQLRTDQAIESVYGDLGAGRFLNRYTGHVLCLDGFGVATSEEVHAGAGLHGEAALVDWELESDSAGSATAKAHLPLTQLAVKRRFSIHPRETVVRIDERITNHCKNLRALHWVQHATVGPPFFDKTSVVSASVARGLTWPLVYEGVPLLVPNAEFSWPDAPKSDGGSLDLSRLFAARSSGFVAAMRQQNERRFGFVSALHPVKQIALVYLFPAKIFPWVAFWEENRCRREWPWSSRAQARGLEFGTTPLPLGNAQVDASGPLFGTPTSLPLGAGASVRAPWAMALVQVHPGWTAIEDVSVRPDSLVLHNADQSIEIAAIGIETFLADAGETA